MLCDRMRWTIIKRRFKSNSHTQTHHLSIKNKHTFEFHFCDMFHWSRCLLFFCNFIFLERHSLFLSFFFGCCQIHRLFIFGELRVTDCILNDSISSSLLSGNVHKHMPFQKHQIDTKIHYDSVLNVLNITIHEQSLNGSYIIFFVWFFFGIFDITIHVMSYKSSVQIKQSE